jgi:GAF domain-containing protein
LELDGLLEQLVARARDVQETQGRLRGLLRAYLAVAAPTTWMVLRHVVEAAGAGQRPIRALGVVVGGRADAVRAHRHGRRRGGADRASARGQGPVGLLVDYPQSLRLREIADHVASVGCPEHHPAMGSFLGVPIRVADRVFGNLYLTEKQGTAEFTADDEELVAALAAAAAAEADRSCHAGRWRIGLRWVWRWPQNRRSVWRPGSA